jgi:hypothetical protein
MEAVREAANTLQFVKDDQAAAVKSSPTTSLPNCQHEGRREGGC